MHKDLLKSLVQRNLSIQYKGSALGFIWILLEPILNMAILSFVFTKIIRFQIDKFPLFILSAILPWNFFSRALSEATSSIIENANLVKKAYFRRELLPISSVLSNFVSLIFSLLVFIPVLVLFKIPLNLSIFFLPVVICSHMLFTLGLAFFLSCVNVYFRDINSIIRFILMLWFYLTPIFYPLSMVPQDLRYIYKLNPMVSIIAMYRNILFEGKIPQFSDLCIASITGIAVTAVGYVIFRKYQSGFAKEI